MYKVKKKQTKNRRIKLDESKTEECKSVNEGKPET